MALEELDLQREIVKMKVFGVGGGGNSVLLRMAEKDMGDIELVAVNTDEKQLARTKQAGITPLLIGQALTRGRGSGGNIEIGEAAARADERKIREMLLDTNLVFLTAGMGGGVGTGATPVVAEIAKNMGILVIGVVTVPFMFEGKRKHKIAMDGIEKMQSNMDALLVVHNENLMKIADKKLSLLNAFESADDVLRQAIRSIAELILTTGVVNVDFADVETIFTQSESSEALLGIGRSNKSAVDAVKSAVTSPLIDKTLTGARGLILNITASNALTLYDVNAATEFIYKNADESVNIIFGIVIDKDMGSTIQATIIATDFADSNADKGKAGSANAFKKSPAVSPTSAPLAASAQSSQSSTIDLPKFMQNRTAKDQPGSKPYAVPAFKLTEN